jgi:hypothetical protein
MRGGSICSSSMIQNIKFSYWLVASILVVVVIVVVVVVGTYIL